MNDKTLHAASHYQGMAVEVENEKLRERVQEMEAQLSAIGAGGVEPLRKPAAQPSRECLQQSAAPEPVARLLRFAGKTRQEVRNPNLTANEAIEVANYIAALQAAPPAPEAVAVPADWWRKRADEIELQVARSGSAEAMRCCTDMRTLLQAAAAPAQAVANLQCKSVRKRLATQWGYVPAQEHATQLAGQGQEHALDADGWYLQDTRSYVGNDVVWWAKDSKGYTTDVSKAHVFTQEEAFRQAAMRGVDRAWPKEYIDGKTRPAVDMQYIKHDDAIAARDAQGGAA